MPLPNVVTNIGPVKSHVRPVAEEIAERWVLYFIWGAPGRGTGDHARGLALDFMTYELGGGVDNPGPKRNFIGNEISAYVLANRARLNVTYLIWNRRIASPASNPPWSWRAYTGSNPHTDHVHVSFETNGPYVPPEDEVTPEDIEKIAQRTADLVWFERLRNPQAPPGSTPPHASEYLISQGNEIDRLKAVIARIEARVNELSKQDSSTNPDPEKEPPAERPNPSA
ncbi:hypothetical protein [Tenggerimyces flavus]|uniref:ARB-07466-like C-terminal domain-containing protein n=1 Tax=Tenggerimyces flavus TaxID=1708749 RepID=A0ABV7YQ64_9ACTN|nr:hypothetical protein [Tenggerimyces flavus]MBM7788792.1 hypothetical protein [Tenggerimyces flavus]